MNSLPVLWEKFFTTPKNISRRFFRAALLTSLFGLPVHVILVFVFFTLGENEMGYVSVGSIIIWLAAVVLARSGRVLAGLLLISMEVITHAVFAMVYLGWHSGFQQYLITLAVAAFIIPSGQRISSWLSAVSMTIYVVLYILYEQQVTTAGVINLFYIPNTLIALLICITTMAYYTRNLEVTESALGVAHEKSETLLNNIMPSVIADRLKDGSITIADGFNEASVLFADIEGFTVFSEAYTPPKW